MTEQPVYRSFNEAVAIIIEQDGTAKLMIRNAAAGDAYDSLPVKFEAVKEVFLTWLGIRKEAGAPITDLAQESGDGIAERD